MLGHGDVITRWTYLLLLFAWGGRGDYTETLATGLEDIFDDYMDPRSWSTRLFPFTPDESTFEHPEAVLLGKSVTQCTLGIAFSGGGTRSLTATYGQLQGLRARGLLDQVSHISATSGGGWASGTWVYAKLGVAEDALVTPHITPEDLTMEELGEVSEDSILHVATDLSLTQLALTAVVGLITGAPPNTYWNQWIHKNVLEPHGAGTGKGDQHFGWNGAFLDPNAESPLLVERNRPYIIIGGAFIPKTTEPYEALPFESTPLYSGTPPAFPKKGPHLQDLGSGWTSSYGFNTCSMQKGVLTIILHSARDLPNTDRGSEEPYVKATLLKENGEEAMHEQKKSSIHSGQNPDFDDEKLEFDIDVFPGMLHLQIWDEDTGNSDDDMGEFTIRLRSIPKGVGTPQDLQLTIGDGVLRATISWTSFSATRTSADRVTATSRASPYSWKAAVGTASVEPALRFNADGNALTNLVIPRFTYWGPEADLDDPKNIPSTYNFIDGGSLENTGIIALLRRKIPKIMAFINTSERVGTEAGGQKTIAAQVAVLFGMQPKQEGIDFISFDEPLQDPANAVFRHNKVFPTQKFNDVVDALIERDVNGEPVEYLQTLDVLHNDHFGTRPYTVQVLWMYNNQNRQWSDRLSTDLQTELSSVENFPHYSTTNQLTLTPTQANFLANMWSTTVAESTEITSLMGDCSSTTSPVGQREGRINIKKMTSPAFRSVVGWTLVITLALLFIVSW